EEQTVATPGLLGPASKEQDIARELGHRHRGEIRQAGARVEQDHVGAVERLQIAKKARQPLLPGVDTVLPGQIEIAAAQLREELTRLGAVHGNDEYLAWQVGGERRPGGH